MSEKMRILVAYDGSKCAENAINGLPRAGLPREAEAVIVSVKERWLPSPFYKLVDEFLAVPKNSAAAKPVRAREHPDVEKIDEKSNQLKRAWKQLGLNFPDWKIETITLHGSPSYQTVQKAKEWNANLIVVGSHGNSGNNHHSLGSVSQKIANEAHCSVRVVRGNSWKKGSPARILIGLDGTRSSELAVEEVVGRMWMMGSEVRLITATDPSKNDRKSDAENDKIKRWIDAFIEKSKQTLEKAALCVSVLIEEGDPKQIIVRAADEWGADCIFIGSNDTVNYYENLLLGSVATAIVARAHCTVEVVRHRI